MKNTALAALAILGALVLAAPSGPHKRLPPPPAWRRPPSFTPTSRARS